MAVKLLNNTTNKTFVLSVNGGAIWELEPGLWRTLEGLSEREYEAFAPYFKAEHGLRHNIKDGRHEVGYLEDTLTNYAEDKNYDKPENFKRFSGQVFEEVWVLTSGTIKVEGETKVGKTAQLAFDALKGKFKGEDPEKPYTQPARFISAEKTSGDAEATINQKNFTIKFTKKGTLKVKAQIEAVGNDTGKIESDELTITVTE